ncbi:MAG: hypothetical protein ABL934_18415 [Lysobacteraceae bacterium]
MFRKSVFLCSLCLLSFVFPVAAQDQTDSLDTIVVTGSRIGYRDLLKTPAISLTKPGDFLTQDIILSNDSRDAETRKRELHDTIAKLIVAAGSRFRVLHNGAYRATLDRNSDQVPLEEDDDRPDANLVRIQIRADLGGDSSRATAVIADMRRFAESAVKVGRTEIDFDGESGLAMSRPERYRYEIIAAIADDARRLVDSLGMQCKVELDGLNSRIEWQRVSASELLLYIPYTMTVGDCSKATATQ